MIKITHLTNSAYENIIDTLGPEAVSGDSEELFLKDNGGFTTINHPQADIILSYDKACVMVSREDFYEAVIL